MTIIGGGARGSSGTLTGGDRVGWGGGGHRACSGGCSSSSSRCGIGSFGRRNGSSSTEISGDIWEIRSGTKTGSVEGSGCGCNCYQVSQNAYHLLQPTPTAPIFF